MKIGQLYGIIEKSKTRVGCVFCGVCIPKANKCIEQHTNGIKHRENIELMGENGISFKDDLLYCKLCKRTLAEDESVAKHIESDDHSNWIAVVEDLIEGDFISLEEYLSSDKEDIHCEVCKTDFVCDLAAIEEHVNSFDHRTKLAEKIKPLNGIFTEANGELWCKICNLHFEDSVESVLNHVDENEQHLYWISEMEEMIEDNDISMEEFLTNKNCDKAFCKRCDMEVLCNLISIEEHLEKDEHINNVVNYTDSDEHISDHSDSDEHISDYIDNDEHYHTS